MKLFTLPLTCTLAALSFACDPAVGEEYTGESLLAVQGSVVVNDPEQADLRPTVATWTPDGWRLIETEVRGEYPSRFQMDVMNPPPADAIGEMQSVTGQSVGVAVGIIALVPPGTEDQLPNVVRSRQDDCNDDGTECTRELTHCLEDDCVVQEFSCVQRACEVASAEGDAVLLELYGRDEPTQEEIDASNEEIEAAFEACEMLEIPSEEYDTCYDDVNREAEAQFDVLFPQIDALPARRACGSDACYTAQRLCDVERGCYREIYSCETTDPAEVSSEGFYNECTLTSDGEDGDLSELAQPLQSASEFLLLYLSEAAEIPGFGALHAGYNVMRFDNDVSLEGYTDRQNCLDAAYDLTLDEFRGSDADVRYIDSFNDDYTEFQQRYTERADECGGALDVRPVTDLDSETLTLHVGAPDASSLPSFLF